MRELFIHELDQVQGGAAGPKPCPCCFTTTMACCEELLCSTCCPIIA